MHLRWFDCLLLKARATVAHVVLCCAQLRALAKSASLAVEIAIVGLKHTRNKRHYVLLVRRTVAKQRYAFA